MVRKFEISKGHKTFLIIFILIFFLPAGMGFAEKLYLFAKTAGADPEGRFEDGRFALIPLANYLLVFAGMLCLLVWAIYNDMFKDVEAPKYTMLENERKLDEEEGAVW
jgi:hypothetical protein